MGHPLGRGGVRRARRFIVVVVVVGSVDVVVVRAPLHCTTPARDAAMDSSTTMMAKRVPLNDFENLAVGAFGGIVETCVQSA